jgi:phenylalanine-4-hydroxylase
LKEAAGTPETQIKKAERQLQHVAEDMGKPSEMALLGRLHWWTVEYGLIGNLENPKIYGAGLLSSIGESASCMQDNVKKLWYNKYTVNYPYDITKTQPQLFVTETFQNLIDVLEEFADTMAFRRGGAEGLVKAIECKNTATAVYSSGLQVSGVFTELGLDASDALSFLKTTGPSALALNGKQLTGHGKEYHSSGFSSPVGKLKDQTKPLEDFSSSDFASIGLVKGQHSTLIFESGIELKGIVKDVLKSEKKVIMISFDQCFVSDKNGAILFQPEWGVYDMAVGERIVSVFNGAADKDAFEVLIPISKQATRHHNYDSKTIALHGSYAKIRSIREGLDSLNELTELFTTIKTQHPEDWLGALEILEILQHKNILPEIREELRMYLEAKARNEKDHRKLINDGLHVIANPVSQLITLKDEQSQQA